MHIQASDWKRVMVDQLIDCVAKTARERARDRETDRERERGGRGRERYVHVPLKTGSVRCADVALMFIIIENRSWRRARDVAHLFLC